MEKLINKIDEIIALCDKHNDLLANIKLDRSQNIMLQQMCDEFIIRNEDQIYFFKGLKETLNKPI